MIDWIENVLMGLRDSCSSLIECSFCRDGNQTMLSVVNKPSAVRILILKSKSVSWWLSLCISCKPVAWIEISLLFSYWRIGLNGFEFNLELTCTSEFLCLEMVFNVPRLLAAIVATIFCCDYPPKKISHEN